MSTNLMRSAAAGNSLDQRQRLRWIGEQQPEIGSGWAITFFRLIRENNRPGFAAISGEKSIHTPLVLYVPAAYNGQVMLLNLPTFHLLIQRSRRLPGQGNQQQAGGSDVQAMKGIERPGEQPLLNQVMINVAPIRFPGRRRGNAGRLVHCRQVLIPEEDEFRPIHLFGKPVNGAAVVIKNPEANLPGRPDQKRLAVYPAIVQVNAPLLNQFANMSARELRKGFLNYFVKPLRRRKSDCCLQGIHHHTVI